ncbi:MAG TPA: hypothetical protein VGO64_02270 [Candidatus Limnocylindrales bacterium]|nr:hypothetical protein [Candidatus Limnocylindrales bacterium]
MNIALRILLLVWIIGYLFVSCVPLLNGHLLIGTLTLVAGIALFVPWLIGIAVLVGLIWLTNPGRRP